MIIGLHGKIGTGKDTVADILVNDFEFKKLSFKDTMLRSLCVLFNVNSNIFNDRDLKEIPNDALFGKTPREVMRSFATEWGRKMVSPDMWVKLLQKDILEIIDTSNIVISDVRFENEASMIKDYGGSIIRIVRPNNPFDVSSNHESDAPLHRDFIDFVINNISDKSNLINAVHAYMIYEGGMK